MQPCPVRKLAQEYDLLAKNWLENEDDDTRDKLEELVCSVERLKPESVTGAAFLVACALRRDGPRCWRE